MSSPVPGYVKLLASGELQSRVRALKSLSSPCTLCPWECRVDRRTQLGRCGTGRDPVVSSHTPHFGEEPPISGNRGSGTIFMGHCNLACVYCQNHQISQPCQDITLSLESSEELAGRMIDLQNAGCHNINWVSPTHQTAQLLCALLVAAKKGLRIPIVYNSNGYDSVAALRILDGIVDIYLPDLKYADPEKARLYSGVPDYTMRSREAVSEMFRQVGESWMESDGALQRGLLIRLLVLPHNLSGTADTLKWIAESLSPRVAVSLMSQYYPSHWAGYSPYREEIGRRINPAEWHQVILAHRTFMEGDHGYVQDLRSSPEYYRPDFRNQKKPFRDIDDFPGDD